MASMIDKTVTGKYQPKSTNVIWVDTSQNPPVEKHFINGRWVAVSGGGGGTKKYSDLEEKPLINGVELDGNKTSQDLGVYSKPSSGIPQSDLAQSVQTSLGKADTAYQKPLSGIPESDLSSDVRQALKKHFKGWYDTLEELKAAHTAADGYSAYVKDASPATTWSIYVYDSTASSDNYWADSGTNADTSNVQTFESGEEVNETYIDDTHLKNATDSSIPIAADTQLLAQKLRSVTFEETKIEIVNSGDGQNSYTGYIIGSTGAYHTSSSNYVVVVPVSGYKRVRFLGALRKTTSPSDIGYSFGNISSGNKPDSTLSNYTPSFYYQFNMNTENVNVPKEYIIDIPEGVDWLCCTNWVGVIGANQFYCYLDKGDDVVDVVDNLKRSVYGAPTYLDLELSINADKYYNVGNNPIQGPLSTPSGSTVSCCVVPCAAGDKFKIFGKGNSSGYRLYGFGSSSKARLSYASEAIDSRQMGYDVTAPTNAAYLFINFMNYSAGTDKVQKLTIVGGSENALAQEISLLDTRVAALEPNELNYYAKKAKLIYSEQVNVSSGNRLSKLVPLQKGVYKVVAENVSGNPKGTSYRIFNYLTDSTNTTPSSVYTKWGNEIQTEVRDGQTGLYFFGNLAETENVTYKLSVWKLSSGIEPKTILLIGDSITQFNSNNGMDSSADYLRYSDWLEILNPNYTIYNCGIGGTRLSRRTTPATPVTNETIAYSWLDMVSLVEAIATGDFDGQDAAVEYLGNNLSAGTRNAVALAKTVDLSTITDVIVLGGTNDYASGVPVDAAAPSVSNINGALEYIISTINTANGKIRVHIVTPPVRYYGSNKTDATWCDVYENTQGYTLAEVVDVIKQAAKNKHTEVFDLYNEIGWNQNNFLSYFYENDDATVKDYVHPLKGFKEIAQFISSKLK